MKLVDVRRVRSDNCNACWTLVEVLGVRFDDRKTFWRLV